MLPVVYGENMFDDFLENGFFGSHNPLFGKNGRNLMKTDIRETDDAKAYRLAIDLPGFKKDDISLDLQNGYLTVSAHRNSSHEDKDDNGRWLRRERYAGSCSRSFYVGEDVKDSDIHASYKDGTLCLEMPKPEAQQQVETKHQIAIKG